VEKKDGGRYRRSYAFLSNIVRFAAEKPCDAQAIEDPRIPVDTFVASAERRTSEDPKRSLLDRFKDRVGDLRKHWFGR
jgi:hypothetical protein